MTEKEFREKRQRVDRCITTLQSTMELLAAEVQELDDRRRQVIRRYEEVGLQRDELRRERASLWWHEQMAKTRPQRVAILTGKGKA